MNALQTTKLSKYRAVHALLRAATETSGIAPLPAKLTALGARLAEIDDLAVRQSLPTRGHTAERDERLAEMIEAALDVSSLVQCYAEDHRLRDLAAQARVRPSDFTRTRTIRRPNLAQRIYEAAAPLVAELAGYGVTAATLADLRTKIVVAGDGLAQLRLQIGDKKVATTRLAEVFAEIDALLFNQIDRLVFPLRRTHPEFYATYRRLRATRGRWRVLRLAATGASAPVATPAATTAPAAKWTIVTAPPTPLLLEPTASAPPAAEPRVA